MLIELPGLHQLRLIFNNHGDSYLRVKLRLSTSFGKKISKIFDDLDIKSDTWSDIC